MSRQKNLIIEYKEKPEEGTGPPMIRWRQSHYVKTAGLGLGLPWTAVFRQPIAPYRNDLYQMYIRDLLVALLFAGLALGIARVVGARFARPIEELVAVTRNLPDQLDQEASIVWPESQVQEIRVLVENGKQTVHALAGAFERLQASQDRYHRVIALTKGVVYERDREVDTFTFIGPEIEALTGYPLSEIATQQMHSLEIEREVLVENEIDPALNPYQMTGKREGNWYVYRAEARIRTQNGSERWISDHAIQLQDEHGRFVKSLGILHDITEGKLAEKAIHATHERYQKVIALTKGVIYERDRDGDRFAFMREEIEALTGYGPDEITPSLFISMIQEREILTDQKIDNAMDGQPLWGIRKGDWHVYRADYRIRTRDGAERWLSDHAVYLPNSQSPFTRSLGILHDITERKQLEERARQQAQLASVGQLAAGIAHDFNNILSVMMGLAETLNFRRDLPEAVRDDLRVIHEQGLRAAQLIRQILDFSRQTVAERKPLDVRALVKDAARLFRRTMPESVVIQVEGDAGRVFIRANQAQIQQALTNLALNARDAMPEGGELAITLRRFSLSPGESAPVPGMDTGTYVAIEVRDTGTGMAPEVMQHLFEPFFTTKPRDQGTGLGLAQVYGIVKQHGGEIAVESEVGRGTAFCMYFPEAQTSGEAPQRRQPVLPRGQGETVLVVEDDAGVLRVVLSVLKTLGYETLSAGNGREAMEMYHRYRDLIRVVLTDMVMPEMGGQALLKALRDDGADVPVVAMSGYPLGEEGLGRVPEGLAGVLSKPLNLMEVAQTLARAIRG